jgi:hypothetical protein
MTRDRRRFSSRGLLCAAGLLLIVAGDHDARADRIMLRGGTQVRGKVVPDPAHPNRVTVLTETGKTPLTFDKPKVIQVIAEPGPLDEYVEKRKTAGTTAEAQFALGQWCEKNKLTGLASVHYEEALRYDKSFGPAHQKLGHVQYADRWLTQDELREAQGLVRYKGKWITKEEKEQREAMAATTAEQSAWVRRLKKLREPLLYGEGAAQRSAEAKLREIKDPAAVKPLLIVFSEDGAQVRALLDSLLASITGPEAARALAWRLLYEHDGDVRQGIMDALIRRDEPVITPYLIKALKSDNPAIVNRAAWGLKNIEAVEAVPRLIPALFTTFQVVVMQPTGGATYGSSTPTADLNTPIAWNGSSIAYLTGPVVGPGVAAYGAVGVPAYGMAPIAGLPAQPSGRGPIPKLVPVTYQNVEVLAALVKLTGRDFGYDVDSWKRWMTTSFKREAKPTRSVPQP